MELDVRVAGVMFKPFTNYESWFDVFVITNFGNGETFDCIWCPFYCILSMNLETRKTYWDGYVGLTVAQFDTWAMENDLTAMDRD